MDGIYNLKKSMPLLIICFLIWQSFYGQKSNHNTYFTIEGKINHFGSGYLVGTITDFKNNTIILDTIIVKNDEFNHKCRILTKQIISYVSNDNRFSRYRTVPKDGDSVLVDFADKRMKSIEIVASPGNQIRIRGSAENYINAYPYGNAENDTLAIFNRKIYPLFDQLGDLDYSDKKNIRMVLQRDEMLVDSISNIENDFIKNHPSSIISSYLVSEKFIKWNKDRSSDADSLLNLLQPSKKDVYFQKMLFLQHNRSKTAYSVGDLFPNFQTKFIYKGSLFNLIEIRGKYVLIDFWGTWCIPCLREMPKLKQFYEKYKDKLIVIGVANDSYQSWKSFLDKNAYTWIQLLDQEQIKLSETVNVEVYPTKYLLDQSGKIIMILKDSDKEVWTKIENLININH
jgi:thiol-disulfide isomerase/thioredoxin